jgi:uncharacterized protein YndB with AHSA1/START domain
MPSGDPGGTRAQSRQRAASNYYFTTRWFFRAPIERVFAELDAVEQWPDWWRGVVSVQVLSQGGPGRLGARTRNVWRSVLPYALTFDAEIVARQPPNTIAVVASGELVGHGRWELTSEAGGTRVVYHWQVATTRAWMNLLAPIARPFFKWNHDVVMRWGGQALARRLGTTLEP